MVNSYSDIISTKKSLKCFYLNACSLVKLGKFDELKCIIASLQPHIVVVTETWIKNDCDVKKLQIPCYTHYNNYRQDRRGGGVSIFVQNTLKHNVIEEYCIEDDIHYLWIHLAKQCLDIGAIYNPNRKKVDSFLDAYSAQLQKRKRAVVFGDFNFDLLKPDRDTRKYKDTLKENNYRFLNKIHQKYCTRETESTKTIIDHVCTNLKDNNSNFVIIETAMSDHKHIYLEIENYQPTTIEKVNYTALNYSKLYDVVKNTIGHEEIYDKFEEKFIHCLSKSKTTKSKLLNPPRQDWINKNIIQDINNRNKIWQEYKKNKTNVTLEREFIEAKARAHKNIQESKKSYYYNYFSNHINKPKKMWQAINDLAANKWKDKGGPNKLIINSNIITDETKICECFNHYFSTIGSVLASQIPTKHLTDTLDSMQDLKTAQTTDLMDLSPATTDEVTKIIDNLDPNTSSGIDGISTKAVKSVKKLIVIPLTKCINDCLNRGVFPDSLKIARVSPILKSGSKFDPCNYRPISVLPVISKIFEKVIYSRLETYLNSKDFFFKKQYGFRPKTNTLSATVDLVTKIKNKIDEKQVVLGIFVDLKKAFDTISHKILLKKLSEAGITGKAHDILKSYFQNRSQIVKIGQHQSSPSPITFGVPQGSILGPLLFLLYINNIQNIGLKADVSLYADDTSLFYFGNSMKAITSKAQNDLNLLNNWFLSNLLTINTAKTNYVIFTAKNKKINDSFELKINNEKLNKKSSEKYLGLILDKQLNWKQHIEKIKNKLTSLTGILRGIAKCLPRKIKYIIYNSLIKPHIDYLIEIWGTANKTNLNVLQISQNKLIKSLFNYDFRTSTHKIYEDTNIMTIKQTYIYYTCILIHKILNKQIHTVLSFRKKHEIQYSMKLRNANHLISRTPRTNYGRKNIEYEGVKMYNKLPIEIKNATSTASFKKKLKSHILNEMELK